VPETSGFMIAFHAGSVTGQAEAPRKLRQRGALAATKMAALG
jgi:hypothetical protein